MKKKKIPPTQDANAKFPVLPAIFIRTSKPGQVNTLDTKRRNKKKGKCKLVMHAWVTPQCWIFSSSLFSQQPSLHRSGDASIVSLSSSWHSRFFILSFLRGYGWLSCCDAGSCVVFVVDDDAAAVWS
jgi:hypothetical protein